MEEIERRSLLSRFAAALTVDTGPLRRHRDFRLLWLGLAAGMFGRMAVTVMVTFQVYRLTHSTLAVGFLELLAFFPMMVMGLVGGAFADAHDRRRIILWCEAVMGVEAVLLLVNSLLPRPSLVLLYAMETAVYGVYALQRPSLEALMPRLVDREELTAASALMSLRGTAAMVVGPAAGGAVIAAAGLPAAYVMNAVTFVVTLVTLAAIRGVPPPTGAPRVSLRSIGEGVAYARSRPDLLGTYLVDMAAMFFGMPEALFPAVADRLGGAAVLGLLTAAPAVGSFVTTATSGWTQRVHRHGRAIVVAATVWGLAITAFGLVPGIVPALVCLAVAGAGDTVSGIFRTTIWNRTIPDHLRGRLAGIELLSYTSGPALGNFEAGAVASVWGLRVSIVSGGLLCIAGAAACAVFLRGFWAYDDRRAA